MAPMQKEGLRPLTLEECHELQAITKASSERVDRVKRATALLAVAEGQAFSAAARAGSRSGPGRSTGPDPEIGAPGAPAAAPPPGVPPPARPACMA